MSENKKYYYMKFKENYFEQDHVKVIESMDNGYIYSLIILKLYLKSLKWEGQLRISEMIPYHAEKLNVLSSVINHDPDHVLRAIQLAKEMGIIEIMSTGEIFMSDIQNFIGHSSSEGERKKEYRKRLKSCNNKQLTTVDKKRTLSQKRPPEIEIELNTDKNNIYSDIELLYNLYPNRDINNKNRPLSKSKKDKDKIAKLLKEKNLDELQVIFTTYIKECSEKNIYMKNFSTFLNNLPEIIVPEKKYNKIQYNPTSGKPEEGWGL